VTEEDDTRTVELQVGDILEVTLDANPTTGYQWEMAQVDTSVLKAVGEPVYATREAGLGAGGIVTLRFEAAAAGETTLNLAYQRPFETDAAPTQTFSLSIAVQR
jgi:inhibitor of cysteine peptidase